MIRNLRIFLECSELISCRLTKIAVSNILNRSIIMTRQLQIIARVHRFEFRTFMSKVYGLWCLWFITFIIVVHGRLWLIFWALDIAANIMNEVVLYTPNHLWYVAVALTGRVCLHTVRTWSSFRLASTQKQRSGCFVILLMCLYCAPPLWPLHHT